MRNPDTDFELAALTSRHLTLLETGDYHDFVLKAGGRSFKVHRCIICPQSDVLKVLCDGPWKASTDTSARRRTAKD